MPPLPRKIIDFKQNTAKKIVQICRGVSRVVLYFHQLRGSNMKICRLHSQKKYRQGGGGPHPVYPKTVKITFSVSKRGKTLIFACWNGQNKNSLAVCMAKIINFLKLGGRKCPICQHFPFELKKKSLILPKMSRENCAYFF